MSLEQWVVVSRSSLAKHGVLVLRLLRLALELHVLGCILVVRGIVERRLGRLGGMRDCGLGCHCCCCCHCLGRLLPLPGGSGYWLASRGTSSCAPTSSAATRYVVIVVIVIGLVVVVVLRLFIVNVELLVVVIIVISALSLRVVVILVIVVGFGALGSTASARRGRLALGSAPLLGTTAS